MCENKTEFHFNWGKLAAEVEEDSSVLLGVTTR